MNARANTGGRRRLRDIAYRRNYEATRHLLDHLGWETDIFWASIMGDGERLRALLAADGGLARAATSTRSCIGRRFEPLCIWRRRAGILM